MDMDFDAEGLRQHLLANDPRFAELAQEHSSYEERLNQLSGLHYPSVAEQIEESTLKKKKLYLKDQMETIARRYKQQAAVGR
ncbi:MAG TPA: DUF465 domain-containing protein [Blastocatellia bacterium]|nr:DUF465 domain-containing protein [Blastocatellia bacterium]